MSNTKNKVAFVTRGNGGSESNNCQRVQAVYWRKPINKVIALLSCIALASPLSTTAQTPPESQSRRERGNQVNKLSGGAGQPVLEGLRQDFPFLADAIVDYSLGEVWSRSELDDHTRQLATLAKLSELTLEIRLIFCEQTCW